MEMALLALSLTRDQFCARYDCLFLCSLGSPSRPNGPQRTQVLSQENTETPESAPGDSPLLVAPLMKVQQQFPSMITLGRTQNNDIVVADKSISKFHAYFRIQRGIIDVADAQSRNGTFLSNVRLQPKQPVPIKPGDSVRFARLMFQLCDAATAWNWIVKANDKWG